MFITQLLKKILFISLLLPVFCHASEVEYLCEVVETYIKGGSNTKKNTNYTLFLDEERSTVHGYLPAWLTNGHPVRPVPLTREGRQWSFQSHDLKSKYHAYDATFTLQMSSPITLYAKHIFYKDAKHQVIWDTTLIEGSCFLSTAR